MPSSKPSSVIHVEDASSEKTLEAAPSLEQTYIESGLSRDDAYILANFPDAKRKKCVRKVSEALYRGIARHNVWVVDRLASLSAVGLSLPHLLYRQSKYW